MLPFFYIKRIISERALEEDVMKIDTEQVIATYKDRIFAIGLTMLKNPDDAEDVVQETFLRYHTYKKDFESKEHIESWLYKVAINKAKDIQRKFWKRKQVSMEDYMATIPFDRSQDEELFQAVMALPSKYSIVIHLYYYEDYSIKEIAQQLKLNEGNVKVRLSRARQLLKNNSRRTGTMKNKEAYKQAFKHVHYQKEVNLNQKRIPKSLITFVTSFIILLSTFTVAYAFDIGGIQSKIEVWFHGEKRMVQYEEVEDHVYHFYTTDEDGNVIDMGTHSGSKGTLTGIEPMSGDELAESMNDNSEIVYDEKEDKCLFYYQDKAIDITKMFDKEKECYLVINNGEKDIYFVISYEDKIDDDCTISQYSDENATVTQGVKVKDIKDRFVRIK